MMEERVYQLRISNGIQSYYRHVFLNSVNRVLQEWMEKRETLERKEKK